MANKQLSYTAERVDELLGIVDGLGEATTTAAGLMSAEDKAKLDSVEEGAEENVIVGVQVGGSALTPADKVVNIPADSAPTSESTNLVRSGGVYAAIQTVANALLNYYTKAQVDALLAGVHQFTYQVVAELPIASADTMYILYFVPSSDPQTQNVKDEYITIRTGSEGAYAYSWERIGSTEIDLSDYPTTEEMNAAIATAVASKADKDDDAVEGNLAKFDANGNPVDAGIAAEKVAKKGEVQTFAGNLVDTRSAGTRQGPFAFRQSGGDGVNYMRKILGRTEAWNQMVNPETAEASKTESGITFTKNGDGSITVSGTATAQVTYLVGNYTLVRGRQYLLSGCPVGGGADTYVLYLSDAGIAVNEYGGGVIATAVQTGPVRIRIVVPSGAVIGTPVVFKPQLVDLTLEGLGLTTADQFRALHPLPYYNYNAGVLKNNAATGLETTGFNQWDEVWENGYYTGSEGEALNKVSNPNFIRCANLIKVTPSTAYNLHFGSVGGGYMVKEVDENRVVIKNTTAALNDLILTTNSRTRFIVWYISQQTTYNHDICINLSDASRNGTYEPYWKRDIVLGLNNLACHDENNNAVVVNGLDGVGTSQDELIVENGWGTKINKRFEKVVIDSDTPISSFDVTYVASGAILLNIPDKGSTPYLVACNRWATDNEATNIGAQNDKSIRGASAASVVFKDTTNIAAGMTASQAKTLLLGAEIIYNLATPLTLTLDNPIPALIEVDDLGTERRLPEDTADNPQAPFECDSNYSISTANLVRKLNS